MSDPRIWDKIKRLIETQTSDIIFLYDNGYCPWIFLFISQLLGASFKSGAVLKKLEIGEDRKRRPDYWLETMKGKSRVLVLQADVEIPSKSSQVAGFCREVCQKLSCCPYLFGPQLVGKESTFAKKLQLHFYIFSIIECSLNWYHDD